MGMNDRREVLQRREGTLLDQERKVRPLWRFVDARPGLGGYRQPDAVSRQCKQGIVLSVFAGPIVPTQAGAAHARPT